MKGPFYVRENGEFKLCENCKECALATTGDEKDAECYLIPCPFMSVTDEADLEEAFK